MSNSFNISVKPEIAAAVIKIDANKAVIDNIHDVDLPAAKTVIDSNKTVIDNIHDTDLPAAVVKIDANKSVIDNIHDTDLPAVNTKVTTVDTVVDLIRSTDVPNIQTNINANETKIDTIDGIVDDIKIKTDFLPQKFRGHFSLSFLSTSLTPFQEVVNVSGQGILHYIIISTDASANQVELRITIDSILSQVVIHSGDTIFQRVIFSDSHLASTSFILSLIPITTSDINLLNVHFDTSLLVEVHRGLDPPGTVNCKVAYSVLSV